MSIPLEPYFNILRNEIATTLMPKEDGNAQRVARYSHEILTSLLVRSTKLPEIERSTIEKFTGLLPGLGAVLGSLDGGMILVAELTEHLTVRPDYQRVETTFQNVVRVLSASESDEAKKLLSAIAEINAESQLAFCQAVEAADIKEDSGEDAGPGSLGKEDAIAFQGFLRARFPEESSVEVGPSRLIVGGGSKHTYIVELHKTKTLPDALVLRIDKSEGVVGSTVADEYALNEAVYAAGLPVPKPYALETDTGILGAPFVIVSCEQGHNIGDWNVVWEPSRDFAIGMAQALAKLHRMPIAGAGDNLPGADCSVKAQMANQIASFESTWRSHARSSIVMEQAFIWLKSHLDFADGQRSIIHCDVGCHNMLGHNGKLSALLDWETAVIGNPAQDLAYAEKTVVQMMPWEEFLEEYVRAGGQLPTQEELDFYRLFCATFRIHFQFIARSFFFAGMSSSMIHAYASQRLHMLAEKEVHKFVTAFYSRYN
jgi:aminoglycoside phosphotransferase (APT) family kinase protein